MLIADARPLEGVTDRDETSTPRARAAGHTGARPSARATRPKPPVEEGHRRDARHRCDRYRPSRPDRGAGSAHAGLRRTPVRAVGDQPVPAGLLRRHGDVEAREGRASLGAVLGVRAAGLSVHARDVEGAPRRRRGDQARGPGRAGRAHRSHRGADLVAALRAARRAAERGDPRRDRCAPNLCAAQHVGDPLHGDPLRLYRARVLRVAATVVALVGVLGAVARLRDPGPAAGASAARTDRHLYRVRHRPQPPRARARSGFPRRRVRRCRALDDPERAALARVRPCRVVHLAQPLGGEQPERQRSLRPARAHESRKPPPS